MPKADIAIYEPTWGNLKHWALHLNTPDNDYVYQVIGESMAFEAEYKVGVVPRRSERCKEEVAIAEINLNDLSLLHQTIADTPVQNDVAEWCCQDYVIEALEALNDEAIVDDEDFEAADAYLKNIFNS